ncbi:centrosomal protein of 68 kDa [Paroedura picta]|uniref:centrosomal protein of 68 kDa n=1 Tax=Paroedura picta TaxID=143630 RepID=UPI001014E668
MAAEGASRALFPRDRNHYQVTLTPSNRRKANYVERKPLGSQPARIDEGLSHFSRLHFYPEDQQTKPAEHANSTQPPRGPAEPAVVLPESTSDSERYDTSAESVHGLQAACQRQAVLPSSSTPKPSPGETTSTRDASTPLSPTGSLPPKLSKDSDFEQRVWTRSKSYLVPGALPSSGAFPPWRPHRVPEPQGTSVMGTPKRVTAGGISPARPVKKMSPYQADYWACAIPDCLPPSPDRQSPHWDPNKEYEDLLDYTYPLRPKYKLAAHLTYGTRDSSIHDSGVDLDSLSASPESTFKSTSVPGLEHQPAEDQTAQRFRTPSLEKPKWSAPVSDYRLSPIGKASFAHGSPVGRSIFSREPAPSLSLRPAGPSLSDSGSTEQQRWEEKGRPSPPGDASKPNGAFRSTTVGRFLRSTRVLPLQTECGSDEEYLPLPPRLQELERLAQQLTHLSLTIRQQEEEEEGGDGEHLLLEVPGCDGRQSETSRDSCCADGSRERSEEDLPSSCEDWVNVHKETTSTDVRDFVGKECFGTGNKREEEAKGHDQDSLAQHIKVFCCQLEQLIRWLHKIAEITNNWIPPRPDVGSVKASLHSYLALKKDLAGHQALTEGVLQDGERLLQSMTSSSPVLQQTLRLIAKQSSELESNADCLYESILGALDALDADLRKSRATRQPSGPNEPSKRLMSTTLT